MEEKFDMTTGLKVVFGYLQATHAQYFSITISIDVLGQHISS